MALPTRNHRLAGVVLVFLLGFSAAFASPLAAAAERGPGSCKPSTKPGMDFKKRCGPLSSGGAARADYNGDGFTDLAIGTPLEDVGTVANAGVVQVAYGSADGIKTAGARLLHPGRSPIGGTPSEGQLFGLSVAGGDFNLDGYSDLAIASVAPARLYVLLGSGAGVGVGAPLVWNASDLGLRDHGWSLVWGNFGRGAEADLAIGEPSGKWGAVTVLYGSNAGVLGAKGMQHIYEWQVDPAGGYSDFGSVLSSGHLGRTGEHDLAIGAPYRRERGGVHVWYGSPDGLVPGVVLHSWFGGGDVSPTDGYPRIGSALAIGDFDGDDDGELAIGAPGWNVHTSQDGCCVPVDEGAVLVHTGTSNGIDASQARTYTQANPEHGDNFGAALASGDFDRDGKRDLAIGAPGEDLTADQNHGTHASNAGAVTILPGSSSGLSASARDVLGQGHGIIFGTAEGNDRFGSDLSAWNWGRGSETDLAIGVPFEDVGTIADSGVIQILYGDDAYGLGYGGQQLFDQSHFGLSVEADDRFATVLY